MIIGVGTDIVEINRMERICSGHYRLERIFHVREMMLVADDYSKAAGNFAVKEAVAKVFGTGFVGFEPNEIEVGRDSFGKPYVRLHGKAKEMAAELGIDKIHVSISNTKTEAVAFAIGEREI
ncbi:MAG: holo-ACP synthase [Lachnospiraceae bacterium]|nr:holo-ACP synthase [Lachnospiraceae bacterium]